MKTLADRIDADLKREADAMAKDVAEWDAQARRDEAREAQHERDASVLRVLRAIVMRGYFWPGED